MTLEKGIWCLWYYFKSLSVGSECIHADANTEGIITSKLSVPGHSCSVLKDRFQKGKSRFCGVKTFLEGGITLRGSEAQPQPHTFVCGSRTSSVTEVRDSFLSPAMLTAALTLLMVVAVAEFFIGLVGNGVLMVWSFGEWVRKFNGSSYNLIVLGLAVCRFLLQWLIMMDLSLFLLF